MSINDDILTKTISWYEFENGSGSIVTDVHGGKDATLSTFGSGTSEFNTTSKLGRYSLRLAGSDASNKGEFKVTDAALTPSFPYSVGFWVRGEVINDSDKNMSVCFGARGCTSDSYAGVGVSVNFSSGVIGVQYGDNIGSNCASGSRTNFAASKSFNANQWYFVVVNFINGSSLDVFVDDVDLGAVYTGGDGSGASYANNDFVIGYFPGATTGSGFNRHNQGWVDNVMVFNDVLTSAERSYLYNNGSGVNYESIVSFVLELELEEVNGLSDDLFTEYLELLSSQVLSITNATPSSGVARVSVTSLNDNSIMVGFRYKPKSSSVWSETVPKPVVVGENSEELSGLSSVDYDVQAFFEFGGDRVFERALTFPVGNPKRMFDNGVKRFDVGYDESQKELLYEEVF